MVDIENGEAPVLTQKAGRREWIGLAILFLPTLLISMDVSILLYSVPFITADLRPSSSQVLWIMDVYGFVLASGLVTMGVLGDRIGRRKLLLFGAAAFGFASILTAYSQSAEMLIVARALLGIGGATLMPSTLALIRNMFHDNKQRSTAIAAWTGATTGGIAVGPILGGFMLDHFWWGAAFLVNVPFMILLLVVAPVLLPEFKDPEPGRFDLISAALTVLTILPIIYAVQNFAENGKRPIQAIGLVGIVMGVLFVRRQLRSRTPLIDLALFKLPAFSGSILVTSIAMFALLGTGFFTTQYLQLVLGLRPLSAALWTLPATVIGGSCAAVAAGIAQKVKPAIIIAVGMVVALAGCLGLSQLSSHAPLWQVLVSAGLISCGIVTGLTLTADLVVSAAPAHRAGSASAVSETSNELGAALGLSVLGTIGTAIYRSHLSGASSAARSSLGEAVSEAKQVPGVAGQQLAHAAQSAFTSSLHVVALSAGGILLVSGLLALVLLRNVAPISAGAVAAAEAEASDVPAGDAGRPAGSAGEHPSTSVPVPVQQPQQSTGRISV